MMPALTAVAGWNPVSLRPVAGHHWPTEGLKGLIVVQAPGLARRCRAGVARTVSWLHYPHTGAGSQGQQRATAANIRAAPNAAGSKVSPEVWPSCWG